MEIGKTTAMCTVPGVSPGLRGGTNTPSCPTPGMLFGELWGPCVWRASLGPPLRIESHPSVSGTHTLYSPSPFLWQRLGPTLKPPTHSSHAGPESCPLESSDSTTTPASLLGTPGLPPNHPNAHELPPSTFCPVWLSGSSTVGPMPSWGACLAAWNPPQVSRPSWEPSDRPWHQAASQTEATTSFFYYYD